jgi:ribose transport system substrate-binding protein
VRPTE